MSSDKLKWDEFVPYAPDVPGEQVRIHHCRSGNQNDRLYIRRTENGDVVSYCHHCGSRGFYRDKAGPDSRRAKRTKASVNSEKPVTLTLPRDFTTDTTTWHPRARAWVRRYGITDDELRANSVGFSEYLGAVVFPVFSEEGVLLTYQYRPIVREVGEKIANGQDTGGTGQAPKYITRRQKDRAGGTDLFVARRGWSSGTDRDEHEPRDQRVVLTEDVLSAIKVSRVPGNVGVALMGSSLKEPQAVKAAKLGRDAAVFLDNDNEEVRRNQRKAKKLLEPMISGTVDIILAGCDPKEMTTEELRETLDGLRTDASTMPVSE